MTMFSEEIERSQPTCRRGEGFADNIVIDGHDIKGRAVPYGYTIELMPGVFERFERGSFARQTKDPARVKVCLEHGQVVGKVVELEERQDGLYFAGGISKSDDIPEARKARAMLDEDLADELSVGFQTVRGGTKVEQSDDQVTYIHNRARLLEISLVPWGAYGRGATVSRSTLLDPDDLIRRARRDEARAWVAEYRKRSM